MLRFSVVFVVIYILLVSCSQGMKGRLLTSFDIGTNTNNILLWISYGGSNYIFQSYQDFLSSSVDRNVKTYLDDNFFLPFHSVDQEVWLVNQIQQQVRILSSSQDKVVNVKELTFKSDGLIQDVVLNQYKSMMILMLEDILPSDYFVSSIAFLREDSTSLENHTYNLTNVFKIETDDEGNFYVFQMPEDNEIRIDVFSPSFIPTVSRNVKVYEVVSSNFVFSSVVVTRPFTILFKFDSLENQQKGEIFLFDMNLNKFSKKYEVVLPRENFQMLSYLRNGFVACATYKGNLPTVMFFDPSSPSFRISHEIYIDFQYPLMMRGFKVDRSGKIVAMFADFPDNRVLFYYWDLISAR